MARIDATTRQYVAIASCAIALLLSACGGQSGSVSTASAIGSSTSAVSCKLAQIPGIGPITASALVASIGEAKNFANGRQVAA